jgi:hypothetical protein
MATYSDRQLQKATLEDVALELEVIQAVGRALARLPDADAQRRVVRWLTDRFQPSPAVVANDRSDGPGSGSALVDPALVVDELADLFELPGTGPMTMHRDADAMGAAPAPAAAKAQGEIGIDSLVRGFVSDFQRLALEWQDA